MTDSCDVFPSDGRTRPQSDRDQTGGESTAVNTLTLEDLYTANLLYFFVVFGDM